MTGLNLRAVARALGGEVNQGQVLAPGPGHSPRDRSLSVWLSPGASNGFLVFSHAGDDFAACRDYVAGRLGLSGHRQELPATRTALSGREDAERSARAAELWQAAREPADTIVERYLASRGLGLPERAADVLRYHPRCPWGDKIRGETIFVPAMLAAMRSVADDRLLGVHRTRLTDRGEKVDRRMLGVAAGAAIKFDADEMVTTGLTVGEGIETCLAARQIGFKPVWALASAPAVAKFPLTGGIETLTLLAENDAASEGAIDEVADRWQGAGREVLVVRPAVGDMNDSARHG